MLEFFVWLKELALTNTFSPEIWLKSVIAKKKIFWSLSLCCWQDVRLFTWLLKRTIFHHIVPPSWHLFWHYYSVMEIYHYISCQHLFWGFIIFGDIHTHKHQNHKFHSTILVMCFSIIKNSLLIESTGQELYCLHTEDMTFFFMLQWRCLFLTIHLFSRSNSATNLCLLRFTFGMQNKWRKTKHTYLKKNHLKNATHQIYF